MGFFSGITDFLKPITGVVGDIMGIASPFMEQQSVASANQQNAELAQKQMDFQADQNRLAFERNSYLSSTAYERAVADMKTAGLNPMLAYSQGGASSPGSSGASGASAVMQPTFRAQSIATASAAAQALAQADNIKADTLNKLATADNIKADTRLKLLSGDTEGYRPGLVANQAAESSDRAKQIRDLLLPTIDKIRADTDSSRATAQQIKSQNMAYKMLADNPDTAPIAALLQLWLGRR